MSRVRDRARAKARIVDATIAAIRIRGVHGATARAIAKTGAFNSGLIYYYFDDLRGAYIAALETTSDRRMARYLPELDRVQSLQELVAVSTELFKEDVKSGTIMVLSEFVSACHTHPDLKPDVLRCMEPWADLAERLISRVVPSAMLENAPPMRDLAWTLLALYAGIDQFYNLDGDSARVERIFEMAAQIAGLLQPFLGPLGGENGVSRSAG